MVDVTNRLGLPAPLVSALKNQRYSRGASRVSVTQLIDAPRISILRQNNQSNLTEDVVDRIWALLGTAMHSILEGQAGEEYIPEERLFCDVEGWTISGGIDLQHQQAGPPPVVALRDYKLTSVWSVMLPEKAAWTYQLNAYAYLVRQVKQATIADIEVVAVLRDWRKGDAGRKGDYPQSPIQRIAIRLWSPEDAEAYVHWRVRLHQAADAANRRGEAPPPCTDEERWARPTTFAVKRPKNKRALRLFEDLAAAETYRDNNPDTVVETRPGESVRCKGDWCGVSRFCDQWAAIQQAQTEEGEA